MANMRAVSPPEVCSIDEMRHKSSRVFAGSVTLLGLDVFHVPGHQREDRPMSGLQLE